MKGKALTLFMYRIADSSRDRTGRQFDDQDRRQEHGTGHSTVFWSISVTIGRRCGFQVISFNNERACLDTLSQAKSLNYPKILPEWYI